MAQPKLVADGCDRLVPRAFVLGADALDWLDTRPVRSGLIVHSDGRAET